MILPLPNYPPYAPNSPAAKNIHPNTLITHVKDRAGHHRRYAINAKKINHRGHEEQEEKSTFEIRSVPLKLKSLLLKICSVNSRPLDPILGDGHIPTTIINYLTQRISIRILFYGI